MINTAASVCVQFLTLNRWGRLSDLFGNRLILLTTGSAIPFLPTLWLVSSNYTYLLAVQAIVGAVIGGWLGTHLPTRVELVGDELSWLSPLYGVFAISALARLLVAGAFLPRLKEVRRARPMSMSGLIFRVTRIHPVSGMVFEIVTRRNRDP